MCACLCRGPHLEVALLLQDFLMPGRNRAGAQIHATVKVAWGGMQLLLCCRVHGKHTCQQLLSLRLRHVGTSQHGLQHTMWVQVCMEGGQGTFELSAIPSCDAVLWTGQQHAYRKVSCRICLQAAGAPAGPPEHTAAAGQCRAVLQTRSKCPVCRVEADGDTQVATQAGLEKRIAVWRTLW